jgi:hypothetical protein
MGVEEVHCSIHCGKVSRPTRATPA